MSRSSKAFFAGSLALTGLTIWGVHFIQVREAETMYQGVIKDEARVKAKALAKTAAEAQKATIDDDCETCRLSPAPELHEATSAEARRRERVARQVEYDRQAELAKSLALAK